MHFTNTQLYDLHNYHIPLTPLHDKQDQAHTHTHSYWQTHTHTYTHTYSHTYIQQPNTFTSISLPDLRSY